MHPICVKREVESDIKYHSWLLGHLMDELVERGLKAKRESKYIDFKGEFDTSSTKNWCEVIKDVIAMSNSGGGVLIFGLDNVGQPTQIDVSAVIELDPASVTDKIAKYTGVQFSNFEIIESEKDGNKLTVLRVFPRSTPVVFTKPGTYPVDNKKQKRAFSQGTVYFRHGAKSEPGTTDDLRNAIKVTVDEVREDILSGVRKVIDSPPGYEVMVLPKEIIETESPEGLPIRLVDDPEAPQYRKINRDISHPYRQKELIKEVNTRLPKSAKINAYDILSIRRVYDLDDDEKYCYSPKFSSNQYSPTLAEWIARQFEEESEFFLLARVEYAKMKKR